MLKFLGFLIINEACMFDNNLWACGTAIHTWLVPHNVPVGIEHPIDGCTDISWSMRHQCIVNRMLSAVRCSLSHANLVHL